MTDLRAKVGELLDDALRRLRSRSSRRRVRNIHEIRKRLKETRALIRLLAPGARSKWIDHLLRDVGRELSAARNADSVLETFNALRLRRRLEPAAYEQIRAALESDRPSVDFPPLRARVIAAREEVARWPDPDPERFDDVLQRGSRSARKAMVRAIGSGDSLDYHEWRKRTKRHWYQCVQLDLQDRASLLHKLSRALGQHHDLVLLREAIARHSAALDAAACAIVIEAANRRTATLEETIVPLGTELFSESWTPRDGSPAATETQPTSDSSH